MILEILIWRLFFLTRYFLSYKGHYLENNKSKEGQISILLHLVCIAKSQSQGVSEIRSEPLWIHSPYPSWVCWFHRGLWKHTFYNTYLAFKMSLISTYSLMLGLNEIYLFHRTCYLLSYRYFLRVFFNEGLYRRERKVNCSSSKETATGDT